jgi:HK97 family phage portal protein
MRFDAGGPIHPTKVFYGQDEALGLPAFYAGVKLISDAVASLPLEVFQEYRDGPSMRHNRWWGPTIFDQPTVLGTQFDWLFQCMMSLLVHGNAWGIITGKDGYGFPTAIEWVPSDEVYVEEAASHMDFNRMHSKVYLGGREMKWFGPDSELFHIPAFQPAGRVQGLSPLRQFALTFTAGQASQRYGTSWYESGGFPPGTFQNNEIEIDAEQAAAIRKELVTSLRRREPLVYGRDWDYKPVTVPPSEAQFIDAMQLTATHIAVILNLPPDRVGGTRGDSLTYSTAEQSTLQIIEALRPWLARLEQAFNKILPNKRVTRFNTDALLKTDLESRMNIFQIARNIGVLTADEIREELGRPPLPMGLGAEALPLTLMNAMGTRAGAIPKSLMKAVVLEMDIAADRLIKLEKTMIKQNLPSVTNPVPGEPHQQQGQQGAIPGQGDVGAQPVHGWPVANQQGQASAPANGQQTSAMMPIGKPNAPLPLTQDPASFLASLITVTRDMNQPYEVRQEAQALWVAILDRWDTVMKKDGASETVSASDVLAPWVPTKTANELIVSLNGSH